VQHPDIVVKVVVKEDARDLSLVIDSQLENFVTHLGLIALGIATPKHKKNTDLPVWLSRAGCQDPTHQYGDHGYHAQRAGNPLCLCTEGSSGVPVATGGVGVIPWQAYRWL
jgi:hypothetical protein